MSRVFPASRVILVLGEMRARSERNRALIVALDHLAEERGHELLVVEPDTVRADRDLDELVTEVMRPLRRVDLRELTLTPSTIPEPQLLTYDPVEAPRKGPPRPSRPPIVWRQRGKR